MIGLHMLTQFFYWYYEEKKQRLQLQEAVSQPAGTSSDRESNDANKPKKSCLRLNTDAQYRIKKSVRFLDQTTVQQDTNRYQTLDEVLQAHPELSTKTNNPDYNYGYNPYHANTVEEFYKTKSEFKLALTHCAAPIEEDTNFRRGDFSIADHYQCSNPCTDEDRGRRNAWENYHMDYMWKDSFANIEVKLEHTLAEIQYHPHTYLPYNTGNIYDQIHADTQIPYVDQCTHSLLKPKTESDNRLSHRHDITLPSKKNKKKTELNEDYSSFFQRNAYGAISFGDDCLYEGVVSDVHSSPGPAEEPELFIPVSWVY